MKSPTVEDRDTSLRANIATIIQESRTTQETAFEVADRVLVAVSPSLKELRAALFPASTESDRVQALTAQVALLREALEEADAALVNVRRLGVVYTYPEDWRCHKEGGHPPIEAYDEHDLSNVIPDLTTALAATPSSAGAELAELREKLRVAEGCVEIEKAATAAAVEWRKKFASELQQLADIIIGGENVPATFEEVLAKAEELREDPVRLEFLMAGGEVKVKQAGRNYSVISCLHYRVSRHDVDEAMLAQRRLPERLKGDPIIAAESKRDDLEKLEELRKDKARLDWLTLKSTPGMGWKARQSILARGYRLHQDPNPEHAKEMTPRAAIDAAMQQEARK